MSTETPIRYQQLGDLTASQIEAIRAIPSHDEAACEAIRATRPVAMFLDDDVFQREQSQVFRRLPVAITPSAMVPDTGSLLPHDAYGVPLIVSRDQHGKVHVFINACMHKGSTLVTGCEAQKGARITCPYHAWSWRLDGSLAGVARGETFDCLDKQKRNLVELPSKEAGGIVWAILDRDAEADFSLIDDAIVADLDALQLGQQHLYGHKQFDLDSNWKQVIEPFLEGYHVQRLHANSVGPLFADVPTVVTRIGDHIRQVSGKVEFAPGGLENEKNIHKTITHAYLLFPNTVIITSPYYMSVMIVVPVAAGKTRVMYHMLTLNKPDNPKSEALYKTSYETVLGVFGNEDFVAAEYCYKGLRTGALDEIDVVYSGLEHCILMQYETLEKHMN
ncbi:aromatic ring-hydroxylating oxygenase subunit alpha [Metapseudomonas boanensis]|uniref:Aromatic ring-hydroxylating dioxygenase subunit alpha n=1 Tax=Metapseudomonas boanensis TaxID=2822138 RepID=A0ABS5XGE8_9GAMM|nr:aromatic ring-hydroxylating dioxygenase subunit alpha [Pseudomonas boanensis]MBT8766744.1 aromatic ring-hydroxylating dioxygenase subunit alpha [Pseudomonas boanensis]